MRMIDAFDLLGLRCPLFYACTFFSENNHGFTDVGDLVPESRLFLVLMAPSYCSFKNNFHTVLITK